jgi:hypothetical protein
VGGVFRDHGLKLEATSRALWPLPEEGPRPTSQQHHDITQDLSEDILGVTKLLHDLNFTFYAGAGGVS